MEILEEKIQLWLESARFVKSKPGVYILYDKNLNALYIGSSENLKKQFTKYIDTNFEADSCKQKTHTYQRIFVENPAKRKTQILEDYKTQYGRLPSCNMGSN